MITYFIKQSNNLLLCFSIFLLLLCCKKSDQSSQQDFLINVEVQEGQYILFYFLNGNFSEHDQLRVGGYNFYHTAVTSDFQRESDSLFLPATNMIRVKLGEKEYTDQAGPSFFYKLSSSSFETLPSNLIEFIPTKGSVTSGVTVIKAKREFTLRATRGYERVISIREDLATSN